MSGYTPKVGDKVRATLGESVVIGRVSQVDVRDGYMVSAVVVPSEQSFAHVVLSCGRSDWQFEQIVSVPSKFGAVIRRADGRVFVRDIRKGDEGRYPWSGMDRIQGYFPDEGVSSGGFTVLFDGVDE